MTLALAGYEKSETRTSSPGWILIISKDKLKAVVADVVKKE